MGYTDGPFGFVEIIIIGRSIFVSNRISEDKIGFIIIKNIEESKFYVEEGTVEFSNNNLLILTSTVKDLKNFDKSSIDNLLQEAQKKITDENCSDKEKYITSYMIETLKEINQ